MPSSTSREPAPAQDGAHDALEAPEAHEKPSAWRRASRGWDAQDDAGKLAVALMAATALMLPWALEWNRHFFASSTVLQLLVVPALLAGWGLSEYLCYRGTEDAERAPNRLLRHLVLPLAAGTLLFGVWALALPGLAHRAVAHSFVGIFKVEEVVKGEQGGCTEIRFQELGGHHLGKLCLSGAALDGVAPGALIKVYGTRSWMGLELRHYTGVSGVQRQYIRWL